MFFSESERLAESRPELRAVIEQVDSLLAGFPRDGVLTERAILARLPGRDPHQVRVTLEQLVRLGVLSRVGELVCGECGTTNGLGSEACSQCTSPLVGANEETVYERVAEPVMLPVPRKRTPSRAPDGRPMPTVAVITALPVEYAAVQQVLGLDSEWTAPGSGAGLRYHVGAFAATNGGTHTVIATLMTIPGNNSAAAKATQVLSHFPNVSHIVMCGIAGGIRDPAGSEEGDVRLGDVVISDRLGVVQYDFGKILEEDFEARPSPRPPSAQLLEGVLYLTTASLRGVRAWEAHLAETAGVPFALRPADSAGARPGSVITYPNDPNRRAGMPRLFLGPIASANAVVRNAAYREQLRTKYNVRAVEMEGSGVADATWIGEVGYLVIRGVADFADADKGNVWHGPAAAGAACVLRALLESMPSPA